MTFSLTLGILGENEALRPQAPGLLNPRCKTLETAIEPLNGEFDLSEVKLLNVW